MARRKGSPQKAAMREMMRDYLKNNDISIKDGTDVNNVCLGYKKVLQSIENAEFITIMWYNKVQRNMLFHNKKLALEENGYV